MKFKEGDYVKVVTRDVTHSDIKSGLFYSYFCGLTGTVERVYDEEVCVKVDPATLPEDILKRHLEIQESIKRKWLEGLSNEARNKLTPEEKQFQLAYTILVHSKDLEKIKPGEPRPLAVKNLSPMASILDVSGSETSSGQAIAQEVEPIQSREDTILKTHESGSSDGASEQKLKVRSTRGKVVEGIDRSHTGHTKSKLSSKTQKDKTGLEVKSVTPEDLYAAESAYLEERKKALERKAKSRYQ